MPSTCSVTRRNRHCWRNSQMGVSSEKVEVFKLASGSYEDTIVPNFLSQHLGGELVIFFLQGWTLWWRFAGRGPSRT